MTFGFGKNSSLVLALLGIAAVAACGDAESSADVGEDAESDSQGVKASGPVERGRTLFNEETFDGNDRTCSSCHRGKSGTISPEDVQELYDRDPNDPLFRDIDSDDGAGESFARLMEDATIRVILPLPPGLRPLDDLEATHIVLNRGVPTTRDIALDPVLMYDGRAEDLQDQALGAIVDHAENERVPTSQELDDIAAFERTQFSSGALKKFAAGGQAPKLPAGRTPSEKRGRAFFEPNQFCGTCHSGAMLNETSEFNVFFGAGSRFEAVFAGELDFGTNEIREWAIVDPDTNEVLEVIPFPFPDPGLALTTGNPDDVTVFKIPTVWGVKDTAPYFHDGSAKTLEDLMHHYSQMHEIVFGVPLTDQDQVDIVRYMKLL